MEAGISKAALSESTNVALDSLLADISRNAKHLRVLVSNCTSIGIGTFQFRTILLPLPCRKG